MLAEKKIQRPPGDKSGVVPYCGAWRELEDRREHGSKETVKIKTEVWRHRYHSMLINELVKYDQVSLFITLFAIPPYT